VIASGGMTTPGTDVAPRRPIRQLVRRGCIEGVGLGELAFDGIEQFWQPPFDRIWKA
jgi:hypothetical protein